MARYTRRRGDERGDGSRHREAAAATGNLALGTPAARASPIAGPYETNQESRRWWIVSPEGDQYEVINLRKWCRDNAHRFVGQRDDRAYAGLRQVQLSLLGRTKRRVGSWMGWTLARPNDNP